MGALAWTHLRAREARVAHVMSPATVTVHEHDTVEQASVALLRHGVSGAPVVDGEGRLIGVFTHSDVLAKFAAPRERRSGIGRLDDRHDRAVTVGDACSRPAAITGPDATVDTVARELLDRDIGRMIVVADDRVVGVVTRADVLKLLLPMPDVAEAARPEAARSADDERRRSLASQMPPD